MKTIETRVPLSLLKSFDVDHETTLAAATIEVLLTENEELSTANNTLAATNARLLKELHDTKAGLITEGRVASVYGKISQARRKLKKMEIVIAQQAAQISRLER